MSRLDICEGQIPHLFIVRYLTTINLPMFIFCQSKYSIFERRLMVHKG